MDDETTSKSVPKKKQVMDIAGPAPAEKPKIQRFGGKNTLLEATTSSDGAEGESIAVSKSPAVPSKVIATTKSELKIVDHTADIPEEHATKNADDVAKEIEALAKSMDAPKGDKSGTPVEVKTKKLSEFKDETKPKPPKVDTSESKAEKVTVKTTPKATTPPVEKPEPEVPQPDSKPSETPEPADAFNADKPEPAAAPPSEPEKPQEEKTEEPVTPPPSTGTNTSGEPSVNMQPTGFIFPKAPQVDGEPNPLKEQADAAKAELQDPKIFDTKEYHVPIKAGRHNRKKSRMGSLIFWLLLLILLAAGILGLIKVGIIHTSINIPYINNK